MMVTQEQKIQLNEIDIEKERKEILKRYHKLLSVSKNVLKDGDTKLIKRAFETAVEAHKDMRRKSGEPYIYHPIEVATICVEEIGLGATAIICALLHDVVEDTEITLEDIKKLFPEHPVKAEKIVKIIDGLTKIAGTSDYGSSQQAENFRKMLLTLSEDVRVILIKLADRLHNMRTLGSMAGNSQLKIASETLYVYAPLAHRLGLNAIKSELEDLSLKFTEPEIYKEIANKLQKTKTSREKFIEDFIAPIKSRLDSNNIKYFIKGRPKHIYSIFNKIKKQNTPFEEIYDLFAVRIIIQTDPDTTLEQEKADCWQVYSIVTDSYKPNPDRMKDMISNPRSNGYESLHSTVMSKTGQWVEVQIRSSRMDEIAERGYAAHWKYKGNETKVNGSLDNWISQVRETLETGNSSAIDFMEDFTSNLYNEEVFIYTPKGELKVLRKGATVLDFAFEIHTQVGGKCTAGKVNNKLVPISHVLQNGDQVEIVTMKNQKPSEDWLKIVVTSKAKTKIKDLLKEENKVYLIDGKDIIVKKLKHLQLENSLLTMNQLRAFFNKKDYNDLFYAFGKGYILSDEIKKFKADKEAKANVLAKLSAESLTDAKSFEKEIKKINGNRVDSDHLLIGDDMDKIDYTLSKCCNPIAGDNVFGFLTVNEGIKVHRTNCPNANTLLSRYGNRVIKAKWASQLAIAFLTTLKLEGIDRVGIVQDITKIISEELSINMRSISIETFDGVFEGRIKLNVNDTMHLTTLMQKLEKIEGVHAVIRSDVDSNSF
jgi:GTP diphosphokinase / guanosine-3',5'-bis(diphosphate) 3'-diphosphatase